jgi:hypothetical protein
VPRGTPTNAPPTGNALGRAEFARAMRKLAEVEALPVYAELCAEADARHLAESRRAKAGNGRVTESEAVAS